MKNLLNEKVIGDSHGSDAYSREQRVNIRIEKVEDIKEPYKYQVVIKDVRSSGTHEYGPVNKSSKR
jgi:hypothetical protein